MYGLSLKEGFKENLATLPPTFSLSPRHLTAHHPYRRRSATSGHRSGRPTPEKVASDTGHPCLASASPETARYRRNHAREFLSPRPSPPSPVQAFPTTPRPDLTPKILPSSLPAFDRHLFSRKPPPFAGKSPEPVRPLYLSNRRSHFSRFPTSSTQIDGGIELPTLENPRNQPPPSLTPPAD